MRFSLLLLPLLLSPALPAHAKAGGQKHPPAAKAAKLPESLEEFLGPPPAKFAEKFLAPARQLRAALEKKTAGKTEAAATALSRLTETEMGEHAGFELASLLREKRDFTRSSMLAEKTLRGYPGSPYAEKLRDLMDENECDRGLEGAKAGKGARQAEAARLLQLCLARTSWRDWEKRESQASAFYDLLKARKDPLLGPFLAEVIQALPARSPLRQRIAREVPNDKLEEYAALARMRSRSVNPPGVKPVYPDAELFEAGMKAVLKKQWSEANALFKRLPAEYPQTEHWDRAQYWIARTEEKLGHRAEAEKRFTEILTESPLSYYGLQCAFRLGRDPLSLLAPAPPAQPAPAFSGTPATRQAVSLWRLRALLLAGLIDQAREEARFLFQTKAGGSTIGQEDPRGALLMAKLYQEAGFQQAAFSHAYAAITLDPAFLNLTTLSFLFPDLYGREFEASAELTGVHPQLLRSVTKQESAFLPHAVSRSDALGLMQLLHPTAQEVIPNVARERLFQPSVNIEAGARYLQKLLDRFQGNVALTLAGYNAGPTRAAQWQKALLEAPVMQDGFDVDVFIDTIPIAETRRYVGSILRNYAWYKLLAKDGTIKSVEELAFQWQRNKPQNEAPALPAEIKPPPEPQPAVPEPAPAIPPKIPPGAI